MSAGQWKYPTSSTDIAHVFILFLRPQITHVAPLSAISLTIMASLPPEASSDLLWVVLGGSHRRKVAPTHHILDSSGEAKNLMVVFSYLGSDIAPSQAISNQIQIQV